MTHDSPVYALLLAAGAGSRFGGNKLMAELNGRPIITHVATTIAEAIAKGLLVGGVAVVPKGDTALAWPLDTAGLTMVENPNPRDGVSSSLRLGIQTVAEWEDTNHRTAGPRPSALRSAQRDSARGSPLGPDRLTAVLVILADQPLLRIDIITKLIGAWRASGSSVRPKYADQPDTPGHPVLLDRRIWPLVEKASGDTGLRDVLNEGNLLIVEVEGENPDVDRPEDLERLKGEPNPGL